MGIYRRPQIIRDGLILYYDAANIKSYPGTGTIWKDLSGNGNNGELVNGSTFDSGNGGSIVFDGVNDYARKINTSHSYLSSSTVVVFLKVFSFSGVGKFGVAGYDFNGGNYSESTTGIINVNSAGTIRSSVITSSQTYRIVQSTTLISFNKYYMATLCKDTINGKLSLYVNNKLESENTFDVNTYAQWPSAGTFIGNNNFIIGSYNSNNWGTGPFLNGSVAHVSLYNRALTAEEILQNYNATKGRFNL